jgi:transposase InsO family protein
VARSTYYYRTAASERRSRDDDDLQDQIERIALESPRYGYRRMTALHSALRHRRPRPGCIHHTDQGVQYACHEYTDLLTVRGFTISMSRQGDPYDNAVCESFFKTLKNEEVYLTEYRTAEEARRSIQRFVEQVYNPKRLHSSLGYVPPVEYELQYKQTALAPA